LLLDGSLGLPQTVEPTEGGLNDKHPDVRRGKRRPPRKKKPIDWRFGEPRSGPHKNAMTATAYQASTLVTPITQHFSSCTNRCIWPDTTAGHLTVVTKLDEELPLWAPIPALAEMQVALEQAVGEVTGLEGFELKRVMRTGTVASVDNRNWEIGDPAIIRRLSQSRAIALDMESAAIAAIGFRFRVPYGTLLCVSDRPLHGEIKLAGMAGDFYRQRVGQHLEIGLKALEKLKIQEWERLHSRKLRSFAEVVFQ
jgi:Phosphorylase superfamily